MSADKASDTPPGLIPNDHDDYRSLLDRSQRGIDSAKAFIHAIRSADATSSNAQLRDDAKQTQILLDDVAARLEQVWDEFQRIYKR